MERAQLIGQRVRLRQACAWIAVRADDEGAIVLNDYGKVVPYREGMRWGRNAIPAEATGTVRQYWNAYRMVDRDFSWVDVEFSHLPVEKREHIKKIETRRNNRQYAEHRLFFDNPPPTDEGWIPSGGPYLCIDFDNHEARDGFTFHIGTDEPPIEIIKEE